jgi:hypothetical protein
VRGRKEGRKMNIGRRYGIYDVRVEWEKECWKKEVF